MNALRRRPALWLRRILLTNASFSVLCTLLFLGLTQRLAGWTGLAAGDLRSLGVELAVFACVVAWVATRDFERAWARSLAAIVAAGDSLWVLGSVALAAGIPAGLAQDLTTTGRLFVLGQALIVADFAFGQFYCWWHLRHGQGELADQPSRLPLSNPSS